MKDLFNAILHVFNKKRLWSVLLIGRTYNYCKPTFNTSLYLITNEQEHLCDLMNTCLSSIAACRCPWKLLSSYIKCILPTCTCQVPMVDRHILSQQYEISGEKNSFVGHNLLRKLKVIACTQNFCYTHGLKKKKKQTLTAFGRAIGDCSIKTWSRLSFE